MEFDSVTINDEQACLEVVESLVQHGRKNIVLLGPTEKLFVARGRFRGYKKGVSHFNLPTDEHYIVPCQLEPKDAEDKMRTALNAGLPVDAVICVGGLVAYGAGRAILKSGRSIPDDIMLAEFGDNDVVARLGVPFLTVYQYPYQMGQKAVDLLLKQIDEPERKLRIEHEIIDTKLIYHETGIRRDN